MKASSQEAFLWGVATSAFQLEGSPHADWSSWDTILSEKPDVTNHYELYREDLGLLKNLGVNAYRFSLEWSRIQPREHVWDEKAFPYAAWLPVASNGTNRSCFFSIMSSRDKTL